MKPAVDLNTGTGIKTTIQKCLFFLVVFSKKFLFYSLKDNYNGFIVFTKAKCGPDFLNALDQNDIVVGKLLYMAESANLLLNFSLF